MRKPARTFVCFFSLVLGILHFNASGSTSPWQRLQGFQASEVFHCYIDSWEKQSTLLFVTTVALKPTTAIVNPAFMLGLFLE